MTDWTDELVAEVTRRWLDGDLSEKNFHFCGESVLVGFSYCEHHYRICHRSESAYEKWHPLGQYQRGG